MTYTTFYRRSSFIDFRLCNGEKYKERNNWCFDFKIVSIPLKNNKKKKYRKEIVEQFSVFIFGNV